MATTTDERIHKFEQAGLGKAPFRCVGHERRVYVACHGAPVQPGSTCDYCSNAIMHCFWIQAADGRRFKVGSDCVLKTGDAGLKKVINRMISQQKTAERNAREDARIAEGWAWVDANAEAIARLPHPNAALAGQGLTLADYLGWIRKNAGRRGTLAAISLAKKNLPDGT